MTKEQIKEEIRKIKEAHAEDEGTSVRSILNFLSLESFVAVGVLSRALDKQIY